MVNSNSAKLRLVLPSDGELSEPTLGFMRDCGIPVRRPSARGFVPTDG